MNELQERTERLLAEHWLERDLAVIETTAAKVRFRQRRAAAIGVLSLALVLGSGAVLAARPDRGAAPAAVDAAGAPEPVHQHADADRIVFLESAATTEQQARLRAELIADPDVGQAWWRTQHDAYDDFRCLFADQPQMIESVTPAILPTSFDVVLADGADAASFDARMRARVEVAEVVVEPTAAEVAASGTSVPWRPEQPSLCDGSPRAGEPIK
jgi:hypothetical protein